MGTGRTGGGDRQIRSFGTKMNRNHARRHIADHHRNKKRADPLGTSGGHRKNRIFHDTQTAEPASGDNSDPVCIRTVNF
jgi:hypothetical protein